MAPGVSGCNFLLIIAYALAQQACTSGFTTVGRANSSREIKDLLSLSNQRMTIYGGNINGSIISRISIDGFISDRQNGEIDDDKKHNGYALTDEEIPGPRS